MRIRTMMGAVLSALALIAAPALTAGPAAADDYVKTINCPSSDPWPGGPLPIYIDIYNDVKFPKDGARGPVLYLIATHNKPGWLLDYDVETTVYWRNLSNGKVGKTVIPSRGRNASWEGSLATGKGAVRFVVNQKIGARFQGVGPIHPQYSSCRGTARV